MNKVFLRNYLIFTAIIMVFAGILTYSFMSGDEEIQHTDLLVKRAHDVIIEAQQLSSSAEGMLASQRGFIITGDESFLERYKFQKAMLSEKLAKLTELTSDNNSQQTRLTEIQNYISQLSTKLEERAIRYKPMITGSFLEDVEIITGIKENILNTNEAVLTEEYRLLNERINLLEEKKENYFTTLLLCIGIGTALILIFNGILFYIQSKRSSMESQLRISEDRFALAIEGTLDGIFDWNIKTGKTEYTGRFFEMLGYDKMPLNGTINDFRKLIHPEDKERVINYIDSYLKGDLSEFSVEYRMRSKSGRWIWIRSRAKALFNKSGKAIRLVGANSDISIMKKVQDRLKAEKQQAEEANQAKTEFLAHMSHEIRTPLTAISGIAEILQKKQENFDDKQKQLVHTLVSSSSTLKDLISDILDFSKIDSGEIELDNDTFTLGEIFESVISIMALRASEKGISFVFDYKQLKDKEFYGDRIRLRQILINLVGNAIKFTEQGGVTIKAAFDSKDNENVMRIEVTDTGIGISPENFDMIFERFKQADTSVSRRFGGTGLGLPISRNLARLMGGDIFLSSEPEKGSTFTLILPAKTALTDSKRTPVSPTSSKKISDRIRKTMGGKTKILVVEDYEGNVVVISYILDELRIDYDVARTGIEAINQWEHNDYDLILMDVQMPEMDGFTACQKIRAMEQDSDLLPIPIIGMTAHALVGDKDKCIEAGMNDYLPKPIIEEDFKKKLFIYLKKRKDA